ncbi:three-helix bundle dimerization domain-containing protein [Gordonia sp. NPDC003424]
MNGEKSEQQQIDAVRDRLAARFIDHTTDEVAASVDTAYHRFDGIVIRDFVPLLVERRAINALRDPATITA